MEALCKAGRARRLALEQRRHGRGYKYSKAYKITRDDELKRKEQAELIRDCNGLRLHFPDKKNGGNSNCGNAANRLDKLSYFIFEFFLCRFFLKPKKVGKIIGVPPKLIHLTRLLLNDLNKTDGYPDIGKFKERAAKAHR